MSHVNQWLRQFLRGSVTDSIPAPATTLVYSKSGGVIRFDMIRFNVLITTMSGRILRLPEWKLELDMSGVSSLHEIARLTS